MSHGKKLFPGEDSNIDSNLGIYDSTDFRGNKDASALNTEGHEMQLPHLPAIGKDPVRNIKSILEMMPDSGDISSCTDSNEEHDIYEDTQEVRIRNESVAPIR